MKQPNCPKCGSGNVRRVTAPIRMRDQLDAAIAPITVLLGAVDRARFGLECDDCGYHGMVIRRSILDRLVVHAILLACLAGLGFGLMALRGGSIHAANIDLVIFLSVVAAVVYAVGVWVIARSRRRLRAAQDRGVEV